MAAKQDQVKEVQESQESDERKPSVATEPKQSFDERTDGTAPWQNEDGSQNNGDVEEVKPAIEPKAK